MAALDAIASLGYLALFSFFATLFVTGLRTLRPTQRGLVERLGKYHRFAESGTTFIIPIVDRMIKVNITEKMVDIASQEIITKDKLNARVAAQIYYKVKADEESVKSSQYRVNNVDVQIVALAQTTLRNIIGTLTLTEANSERNKINADLMKTLTQETNSWGIDVVRSELREINPPQDVQETMNKVVKAENEKIAARDFAAAKETEADGLRRAAIKQAEGVKAATVLEAEGKAQAIQIVNEAAEKYFVGNAQLLRQLEVAENSFSKNSLFVIPEGQTLVAVLNSLVGQSAPIIIPTANKDKDKDTKKKQQQQ
ncbi:MAG: SPFH/Band 7/PHB domain protein [Thaumarchaeota archaeon]|nr:SPFH/Band 7/PHB domain protein [Nitrososphaerota archaeon]